MHSEWIFYQQMVLPMHVHNIYIDHLENTSSWNYADLPNIKTSHLSISPLNFTRKNLSIMRLKFLSLAAQILLGPSSDRFTSIFFFYKNTYQIFMSNNHSLLLIFSNKMPFHERLAQLLIPIAQVLYIQITIDISIQSRSAFCNLPISSNKILK